MAELPDPYLRFKEHFLASKGQKIIGKLIIQNYKEAAQDLQELLTNALRSTTLLRNSKARQEFNVSVEEVL
jgi:hypothetical protein